MGFNLVSMLVFLIYKFFQFFPFNYVKIKLYCTDNKFILSHLKNKHTTVSFIIQYKHLQFHVQLAQQFHASETRNAMKVCISCWSGRLPTEVFGVVVKPRDWFVTRLSHKYLLLYQLNVLTDKSCFNFIINVIVIYVNQELLYQVVLLFYEK